MIRVERFFLAAIIGVGVISGVQAQAIVDASGGGNYTTINDALAANETDIVVKNSGVYHEGLLITRDVNLRGEDPANPPVIAMTNLASQPSNTPNDGIYLGGDGASSNNLNITFKNFILIPDMADGPADDAITVTPNPGSVLTINIENILCAPNDGSDKPLTTDIWANPDLTAAGIAKIPDDGLYLMNHEYGGFDGDVNATLKDVRFIGVGGDSFVLFAGTNGNGSITGSGLASVYSGRYAAQANDKNPITITGTQENPGWVARKNKVGILLFQGGAVSLDHVISVDNSDCGLRVDADSNAIVTITNSLFARNWFQGITIPWVPTEAKTWTISDCTFFNNDTGNNGIANLEIRNDVTADLTLNVNDCIFAGTESEAILNTNAIVTANNCGFVTAGPNALPAVSLGTPPVENNSVNADPDFVNVDTDPLLATSFDVQAADYATASSTSGPLNGWGDGPNAKVRDWSVY